MTDQHNVAEVETNTSDQPEPIQTAPDPIRKGPAAGARLAILVVFAGILAVALAVRPAKSPEDDDYTGAFDADGNKKIEDIRREQSRLRDRELPGQEPEEPPVLNIDVHVDAASGKNRLLFNITEEHGYYVEEFNIQFWYKDNPEVQGPEDSPVSFIHPLDKYVKAHDTLADCVELSWAELIPVNGDMGTDENWEAEIIRHGRARLQNPDPLPVLGDAGTCR